jgi:N12 class adenine-specific DNA methylase
LDELENTIFLNPKTNEYETKDNYLSGNVKEKLEIAMDSGEDFEKNVEELLKVQPEPLKIYDIGFKLGSNWIPTELYKDFIFDILETPYGLTIPGNKSTIDLHYNKFNSEYKVENKNVDFDNVLANTKFGTKFTNAYKLIEDSLNLKFTTVYERIVDEDGNKKSIVNQRETQISRAKQEVIKNEFINWITRSEKRITKIEKIYNKNFNVFIPRKYDGSNLIIPTMNSEIELRPHQKDAAMRILLGGNTLIAHEVGSGKTMTLATGAILLKQSGIAKKPLFVVPNHLPQQWASEFLNLFPTSNILVPTKRDFEKKNRQKFIAKIATGDYDAVILTFSQFEKIPMSNEFINNQIKTHINEITDAISEIKRESLLTDFSVKQYESMKKKLEDKLLKMADDDKKDKLLTFEELGIDYIFCDEAQEYKNCYVHSKMTNVAGISNVSSNKSYDMLMKTKYITEKNNGRGVIFATGTPVTNSISETYVMQRYLQESTLLDMGIRHFDQWASIYGDITSSMELDPTGTKYRIKTRFSKFHNMPELLKIFNQIADFKSFDDLNIKRPDIETGKPQTISVKPSQYVKNKMIELEKRADSIKNSEVDSSEDNMLLITNHGRAIAIDPRILDPYAEVDNDSKLYKCTENVAKIYKEFEKDRSLQLIFLDYGIKLYDNIKEDLILKGIKSDEIAFIGDAKNDKEKESLFSKCRRGDVRILIGSTFKMGAGTNVQNRMIALHNLDCPWRPADLQQRNGRIRRQGNMYDKIKIFQYITEATFDSYSYQILEKKQMFISQLMKNDFKTRVYDDLDAATLEYSEIKALCCGDPRIKEKADIDNEIQKLQIERNNHLREQDNLKSLNKKIPENILFNQKKISDITCDLDKLQKGDKFEIILKSQTYTKRIDAGENLNFIIDLNHQKEKFIGYYKGLEIRLYKRPGKNYLLGLKGKFHYNIELGDDPVGNIKRIENIKFKYIKKIELINHQNNSLKKQLETVKDSIGKPFLKENLLSEKLHRQSELAYELEKPEFEEKTPSPQIDNSNNDLQTKPKDKLSLTIK